MLAVSYQHFVVETVLFILLTTLLSTQLQLDSIEFTLCADVFVSSCFMLPAKEGEVRGNSPGVRL